MKELRNTFLRGNVEHRLKDIPDNFVDTVVTSPPYWNLRDYGTANWTGGDKNCDHFRVNKNNNPDFTIQTRAKVDTGVGDAIFKDICGKCGAKRVDDQIGLEPTPELYVQRMVAVFREIWRVLKPTGTVWLNLGDSYCSQGGPQVEQTVRGNKNYVNSGQSGSNGVGTSRIPTQGLKPKDLVGIPWMVAFALRADGWYLRSEIIWYKRNPMPESCKDRPTKSHEQIFLLAKKPDYFYDFYSILEPAQYDNRKDTKFKGGVKYSGELITPEGVNPQSFLERGHERWPNKIRGFKTKDQIEDNQHNGSDIEIGYGLNGNGFKGHSGNLDANGNSLTHMMDDIPARNKRTVWDVTTRPFKDAHFATFPEKLIEPCIKAGASEHGCCELCGKPWERILKPSERYAKYLGKSWTDHDNELDTVNDLSQQLRGNNRHHQQAHHDGQDCMEYESKGWQPTCTCNAGVVPSVVLDPFSGAGTTALVSRKLGRDFIAIELSEKYIAMSEKRLHNELGIFV